MEFIVLALTVPVFYIIGLVATIRYFLPKTTHVDASNRLDVLRILLSQLSAAHKQNPTVTVSELIALYTAELSEKESTSVAKETQRSSSEQSRVTPVHQIANVERSTGQTVSLSSWYSENSVNLLLYIGAFLIVLTASILVGFQWQSMSGFAKALALTGTTLFFLVSGVALYYQPTVRNAGSTFSGIGTVLIPFVGMAWYNFVLRDMGIDMGLVWAFTSLLVICISMGLGMIIKNGLYTYIASFGSLSFVFALVNTTGLRDEYYILGAQLNSFVLLAISRAISRKQSKQYLEPVRASAEIIAPLSLLYGAYTAISHDTLFTIPSAIAVGAGSLFYLSAYLFEAKEHQLALTEGIGFIAAVILVNALHFTPDQRAISLSIFPMIFMGVSYLFSQRQKYSESHVSGLTSIFVSIYLYVMLKDAILSFWVLEYVAFLPAVISIVLYLLSKKELYLLVVSLFFGFATHHAVNELVKIYDPALRGLAYAANGCVWYLAYLTAQKNNNVELISLGSMIIFFLIGISASNSNMWYMSVVTALLSLIFLDAALRYKNPTHFVGTHIALYWTVWNLLSAIHFPPMDYPYVFTGISASIYLFSMAIPAPWQYTIRILSSVSLVGSSIGALVYIPLIVSTTRGLYLSSVFTSLEIIISSYGATLFFLFDMLTRATRRSRYTLSCVVMMTLSLHLRYFGLTDALVYSVWWGLYLSVVGFFLHKEGKDAADISDAFGLFFLIVPPLMLSFGADGARSALILGITGLGMLIYGISSQLKTYTYVGIFAIVAALLSQTYSYIFGMEKWMMTGMLGAVFLAVALYILIRRKTVS